MEFKTDIRSLPPCPICESKDLSLNHWHLDALGEVEAVECKQCFTGAPVTSWVLSNKIIKEEADFISVPVYKVDIDRNFKKKKSNENVVQSEILLTEDCVLADESVAEKNHG